jgi:5'-deoxynucleotidase YfbR-like HD superfamily hydrolase
MSDKILEGKEISYRYLHYLKQSNLKLAQDFSQLAEEGLEKDDMSEYILEYQNLFSKYRIDTDEKKQVLYMIEKIREYYK